jgi:hypothetical protein
MTSNLVKIHFELNPSEWHQTPGETLWAEPLIGAGEPAAFRLENSPCHAFGVSYQDVVRAVERDGMYEFAGVIAHSGRSTYRLVVDQENDVFWEWWKKLQDLGCTYESGDCRGMRLYAVDVPAEADIHAVYAILEKGEEQKIWRFEEGHVGHPLKNSETGETTYNS